MARYPMKLVGQKFGGVDMGFLAHYRKSPVAADTDRILVMTYLEDPAQTITDITAQPDVPRNLTVVGSVNAAGTAQVETATVVGTIAADGAGNASVTVTGDELGDESPIVLSVAVANEDTASQVAGKIRTALGLNATISGKYVISGATDKVILTNKVACRNDTTLNIAIDNGTCAGLTAAPTSADTTPGVAPKAAGTITVTGKNALGATITEDFALNGTSSVVGNKAFASVTSILLPAVHRGCQVSVGVGSKLGLYHVCPANRVIKTYLNHTIEGTDPTVTSDSDKVEKCTVLLNSALDGNQVDIWYMV